MRAPHPWVGHPKLQKRNWYDFLSPLLFPITLMGAMAALLGSQLQLRSGLSAVRRSKISTRVKRGLPLTTNWLKTAASGYLNGGVIPALQLQSYTVEAIVRVDRAIGQTEPIVSYATSTQDAAGQGWYLSIGPTGKVQHSKGSGDGSWESVAGATTLVAGNTYRIAATNDGAGRLEVFIEGVSDGVATGQSGVGTDYTNATGLTIGFNNNGTGSDIQSSVSISDVRVWSGVVPTSDLAIKARKRLVGTHPNLVGYWRLDTEAFSGTHPLTAVGVVFLATDGPYLGDAYAYTGAAYAVANVDIQGGETSHAQRLRVSINTGTTKPTKLRHSYLGYGGDWYELTSVTDTGPQTQQVTSTASTVDYGTGPFPAGEPRIQAYIGGVWQEVLVASVTRTGSYPAYPTETINGNGGPQTITVPAGAKSMVVDMYGAEGGPGNAGTIGGKGARLQATIPVTAGETLQINVGGKGFSPGQATYGYDMTRFGPLGGNAGAGGGGGATDIRRGAFALADRILVAGAGGGGGGNDTLSNGGHGGQVGVAGANGTSSTGGGGGTASAGGSSGGGAAVAGSLGLGGAGEGDAGVGRAGGSGGNGYYGGGGGSKGPGPATSGAGGGGGSSYTDPSAVGVTHTQGARTGHGLAVVTFSSSFTFLDTYPVATDAGALNPGFSIGGGAAVSGPVLGSRRYVEASNAGNTLTWNITVPTGGAEFSARGYPVGGSNDGGKYQVDGGAVSGFTDRPDGGGWQTNGPWVPLSAGSHTIVFTLSNFLEIQLRSPT